MKESEKSSISSPSLNTRNLRFRYFLDHYKTKAPLISFSFIHGSLHLCLCSTTRQLKTSCYTSLPPNGCWCRQQENHWSFGLQAFITLPLDSLTLCNALPSFQPIFNKLLRSQAIYHYFLEHLYFLGNFIKFSQFPSLQFTFSFISLGLEIRSTSS